MAVAPLAVPPVPLVSTHEFAGMDAALVGGEPPDTWVAVNSTRIVETVNGAVRVSDRSGNELATFATWALFSIPAGWYDSDPRIIWDNAHGRWVGVLLAFNAPDFSDNFLSVAVSDTSDPLGGWSIYQYGFGSYLPDYPAIASSGDKIVVTQNEFDYSDPLAPTFAGSSFFLLPWSSILAGTDVVMGAYGFGDFSWNLRPARLLSSTNDVHLVYEHIDGTLWYLQLRGSAATPSFVEDTLGLPAGLYNLTAPEQPDDVDGIALADDGRITDVAWRANHLWFARTLVLTWDSGSTEDLGIEVTHILTTSGGLPTLPGDSQSYHGGLGVDAFMPGIGLSADGTVFTTYSRSSSSTAPELLAEAFRTGYDWSAPIVIESSDSSYDGARWGDFAGVALDPATNGTATVWQAHEVAAIDGTWRTVVSRLVLDLVAPAIAAVPNQGLDTGSTLGKYSVPVRIAWAGTETGSGISTYQLAVAEFGDTTYYTAALTPATLIHRSQFWKSSSSTANLSYKYEVRGIDEAGNVSAYGIGSALTPTVFQQNVSQVTYHGSWSSSTGSAYSGGGVRYSSSKGAYASFKTSGRSFAFVTTKASSRGKAKVYVDGVLKKTLTLTSSSSKYRNLAYVLNLASSGTHTIKVVVYSGRVDIDAFLVLR